jgi:hypothetical protein
MDWIDRAAESIVRDWPMWEAEAEQIAQSEQDGTAGSRHLVECVEMRLRLLRHEWEGA